MERPEIPATFPLTFELSTRWCEEDAHGILNNAVYLTLMEEARYAQLSAHGALAGSLFPFVLAQANVHFVRPGAGGARVLVDLATLSVGTTSFRQAYCIRECEGGEVWCRAEALLVCVDEAGAKTPVPPPLLEALAASRVD